jgi:hypothetical protein
MAIGGAENTKPRGKPFQASEVLHDRDAGIEQAGVGGVGKVCRVVDVPEVDPDELHPRGDKTLHDSHGKERCIRPALLRPPSRIPPRAHQDRSSARGPFVDLFERYRSLGSGRVNDDARQADDRLERQPREIFAVTESVERRIEVGPRVAGQLGATEEELCPPSVPFARGVVIEDREDAHRRETRVGGHPVLDRMRKIDERHHTLPSMILASHAGRVDISGRHFR